MRDTRNWRKKKVMSSSTLTLTSTYEEGRYFMPMYDYKCLDCGKESLVALTLTQHESNKVTCPKCGSGKMQQLYTSFIAHTTKKS